MFSMNIFATLLYACNSTPSNNSDTEPDCPATGEELVQELEDCYMRDDELESQQVDIATLDPAEQCHFEYAERWFNEYLYPQSFAPVLTKSICFPEGALEQSDCAQRFAECYSRDNDSSYFMLRYFDAFLNSQIPPDSSTTEYHTHADPTWHTVTGLECGTGVLLSYDDPNVFSENILVCNGGGAHAGCFADFFDECEEGTAESVYTNDAAECEVARAAN